MTATYVETWESLHRVFDVVADRVADPVILTSLPYQPEGDHHHTRYPLVLGPPGRVISVAIGLRAALPHTPLIVVSASDSVTLGTNHLMHAARRNMGMTLVMLRSDLLESGDASIDRAEWGSSEYQTTMERTATPLEWASALQACFVGRGSLLEPDELAELVVDAVETPGFGVIGLTAAAELETGVVSRRSDWAEYFTAYRSWTDSITPTAARPTPDAVVTPRSSTPERVEIRIAGIGGQGVKLAGTILSEAAGLGEGLWATQYGDYGSATRGGPSQVDVVVGSKPISYPGADDPDVLIVLGDEAAARHIDPARPARALAVDCDAVESAGGGAVGIPVGRIAREHTGKPLATGVTSLGCVAALTDAVSMDSLRSAVAKRVPARAVEANIAAMEAAYDTTRELVGGDLT